MSKGGRNSVASVDQSVRERARTGEPDRYLSALLAPATIQSDLIVLSAFLADVAAIPSAVSEPLIGEMRLQWWRDVVTKEPVGALSGHPIADALVAIVAKHKLPTDALVRIVDARSHDLTGELHTDDGALSRYLADTEGLPFALAAMVSGRPIWPADMIVAAGKAYGLARQFGRLPALIHNGGFPLPAAALADAGIDPTALSSRPYPAMTGSAIEHVVEHYVACARRAQTEVRAWLQSMTTADQLAALPLAMVEPYFNAQKAAGFVRLEMLADVAPLRRIWQLAKAHYVSGV